MIEKLESRLHRDISLLCEDDSGGRCCWCLDSSYKRFSALFFIILTAFFYSANFDMPGAMVTAVEKTFSVSSFEYEYLYSVYSLPNVVTCFFGGLLVDNVFGLSWGSVVFGLVAVAGQVIITAAGFTRYYSLMLVGRFVNGIGAEPVSLALCCFIVVWFEGRETCFMFGLLTAVVRLGSAFAFLTFTPLYNYVRTHVPIHLAFGTAISLFLAVAVVMLIMLASLAYYSRINSKPNPKSNDLERIIRFKDILTFPLIYWIILLMLSICNNAIFAFLSIAQQLLERKYGLTEENANYLSSAFNLISAIVCPFPGLVADTFGRDLYFNLLGMGLGVLSQAIMAWTTWNPLLPLTLYATYYAIINSCAWPLVARVVSPYQLATAYGTLQCFINVVGAANNILAGYLLEIFGADGVCMLFLCNIALGALCCLFVCFLNCRSKGTLNLTSAKRRNLIQINKPST